MSIKMVYTVFESPGCASVYERNGADDEERSIVDALVLTVNSQRFDPVHTVALAGDYVLLVTTTSTSADDGIVGVIKVYHNYVETPSGWQTSRS